MTRRTPDHRINRRQFLGTTAAAAAVAAVGPGALSAKAQEASPAAGEITSVVNPDINVAGNLLKAPEPEAKRGGTIRIGGFVEPALYDLDQSPSIANLYPQSPMFDNLIRFNPLDGGQTIIPDLAESWEISDDGLTYTFHLREGVTWHDGTPLTAADVVATFDRRRNPPEGVVSIRQTLYTAVTAIEAVDDLTVTFKLSDPQAFFLEALATGWSVVLQKASLDANDGNLARVPDFPGTGPYMFGEITPGISWSVNRNENYWNPELPYLDQIVRIAIPDANDRGSAVLTGDIDFADHVSIGVFNEALNRPDEIGAQMNPATWAFTVTFNVTKPPFDDARVRRALHLAIDRRALAEAYAQTDNIQVGTRWCHPSSPLATPEEVILQLPGYRADKEEDIAEAQRLLAEAGYEGGNGMPEIIFLLRGTTGAGVEVYGPAFQALMQQSLGIACTLQPVDGAVYFDVVQGGDFNMTSGVPAGAINDPSDYWGQWYKTGGGQNYGSYSNPEFDDLLTRINREMNLDARRQLVRQAEDILDQECPMWFHGWGNIGRLWRLDVKGIDQAVRGTYLSFRYDTLWLDR